MAVASTEPVSAVPCGVPVFCVTCSSHAVHKHAALMVLPFDTTRNRMSPAPAPRKRSQADMPGPAAQRAPEGVVARSHRLLAGGCSRRHCRPSPTACFTRGEAVLHRSHAASCPAVSADEHCAGVLCRARGQDCACHRCLHHACTSACDHHVDQVMRGLRC